MLDMAVRETADEEAFFRDRLLAWARDARSLATWILGDAESGSDAVQETALLAWQKRQSLRDPAKAETWLNQILVNVCRQELRRRTRFASTVRDVNDPGVDQPDLAEHEEIAAALASLTPDEQIVIALRYGRDLSVSQIADRTKLKEGTVKSRLHYGLEHLKGSLAVERRRDG